MARILTIAPMAGAAVLFVTVGVESAAWGAPTALLVPQSTAFSVLGHSCGGIQEQAFATGFDATTGLPTGDVYLQTRCGGSGKGGGYHTTTYSAWVGVTWDFTGTVISSAVLASAPNVDPTFSAFDSHGNEVYNQLNAVNVLPANCTVDNTSYCTDRAYLTATSGGSTSSTSSSSSSTSTMTSSPTTTTLAAGPCSAAPQPACKTASPAASKVTLRERAPATADQVSWKWKGQATVLGDFGDPLTTTGYAICIYQGTSLKLTARAPAGDTCGTKPCWKPLGTRGYGYNDSLLTPDGLSKVTLKAGLTGKAEVAVKGKGANLPDGVLPLTTPVIVQLQATTGQCWTATFGTAQASDAGQFKAKSD
jgi:hypothetical protein